MSVCANALDCSHPAGTQLPSQSHCSDHHTGDERNVWGHFQLQAGTLTSAKAAQGERKPSARGCLSFQQLSGEVPNIEMHLTWTRTTRTHHPTPRSSTGTQTLAWVQASLQGSLNSQTKQLPASTGQENPTGEPGRRLGWRGHIIIPNAQQTSPLRQ